MRSDFKVSLCEYNFKMIKLKLRPIWLAKWSYSIFRSWQLQWNSHQSLLKEGVASMASTQAEAFPGTRRVPSRRNPSGWNGAWKKAFCCSQHNRLQCLVGWVGVSHPQQLLQFANVSWDPKNMPMGHSKMWASPEWKHSPVAVQVKKVGKVLH